MPYRLFSVLLLVASGATLLPLSKLAPPPTDSETPPSIAPADSVAEERARYVEEVLASIAGREQEPAGEVFEDVEAFAGVPAERFLRIMDRGFGRSLGVSCTHCHTPDDWAASDSTAKRVARQMVAMSRQINEELLPAVEGIRSERPVVNCTTCHRGQPKPATSLPE
jgi:hypothetical protein